LVSFLVLSIWWWRKCIWWCAEGRAVFWCFRVVSLSSVFYSFILLKERLPVENYGYDAVFFISCLILCFVMGRADTCAYFAGRAFGKHKLCPVVSPKKTVEGAIGGVLGTMVFGVVATIIYSMAANRMEAFTRSNIGVSMYVIIALLGCIAAVLGIYGDLFASVVKRQCGIKDYGTIFPGHGGILDRFDSVMFIAPFVTMVITARILRLIQDTIMSKKITLLGSTGSIGTQSLDVIRAQGYEVYGLSAHSHVEKILQQIEEFHPKYVCMTDPDAAAKLDAALAGRANAPKLLTGPEGLKELAALDGPALWC